MAVEGFKCATQRESSVREIRVKTKLLLDQYWSRHQGLRWTRVARMEPLFAVLFAIPEFIGAVLSSWAGYVTGGLMMAIWWAWERRFKEIDWKYARWPIIGFFVASFFSVWYEQRSAFLDANNSLKLEQRRFQKSQGELETGNGQIEVLTNQIQTQQNTIIEALVQLGKAQQQEPLKISNYPLGSKETRRQPGNEPHDFLIIANKPVTPVRLIASCDGDIIDASWRMLGTLALTLGGTAKSDKRRYSIEISSPPVTPTNPVLVTLYATQKEMKCSFSQS